MSAHGAAIEYCLVGALSLIALWTLTKKRKKKKKNLQNKPNRLEQAICSEKCRLERTNDTKGWSVPLVKSLSH